MLRVGALAGVAAAVATELVAAVARVSDVSMEAGGFGADTSEPIPVLGFAFSTLLWTAVGIVIAVAMTRWAKRPAHTFTVTAVVLTAVSFVPPALAGATTTGTKIILALTHVSRRRHRHPRAPSRARQMGRPLTPALRSRTFRASDSRERRERRCARFEVDTRGAGDRTRVATRTRIHSAQ